MSDNSGAFQGGGSYGASLGRDSGGHANAQDGARGNREPFNLLGNKPAVPSWKLQGRTETLNWSGEVTDLTGDENEQAAGGLRQSKDANIPPPVPRHAPPTAQSPGGEVCADAMDQDHVSPILRQGQKRWRVVVVDSEDEEDDDDDTPLSNDGGSDSDEEEYSSDDNDDDEDSEEEESLDDNNSSVDVVEEKIPRPRISSTGQDFLSELKQDGFMTMESVFSNVSVGSITDLFTQLNKVADPHRAEKGINPMGRGKNEHIAVQCSKLSLKHPIRKVMESSVFGQVGAVLQQGVAVAFPGGTLKGSYMLIREAADAPGQQHGGHARHGDDGKDDLRLVVKLNTSGGGSAGTFEIEETSTGRLAQVPCSHGTVIAGGLKTLENTSGRKHGVVPPSHGTPTLVSMVFRFDLAQHLPSADELERLESVLRGLVEQQGLGGAAGAAGSGGGGGGGHVLIEEPVPAPPKLKVEGKNSRQVKSQMQGGAGGRAKKGKKERESQKKAAANKANGATNKTDANGVTTNQKKAAGGAQAYGDSCGKGPGGSGGPRSLPPASGRVMLDHFGNKLDLYVPDGHPGCMMPLPQQLIRSVGHLDVEYGHRIRLHLGKVHTPTCTTNQNYQPTVPSVQVAPLIMDVNNKPQKDQGGRWVTGPPVTMTGQQLAERMRSDMVQDQRRVVGYVAVP